MTDAILILNAGSSILKFSVFRDGEPPELLVRGQVAGLQTAPRFVASKASGEIAGCDMINCELLREDGILIIRPTGSLEAGDFQKIAREVDPYIAANGKLNGLMIEAESFPGWKDFAALVAHLKFVRDHHRKIEKVAAVSDNSFLSIAPKIASHFVQADVRHFPESQRDGAFAWLRE
jgi:hypothetical protein